MEVAIQRCRLTRLVATILADVLKEKLVGGHIRLVITLAHLSKDLPSLFMLIYLEKFFNSLVEAGLLCRHLDLTRTERVFAVLLLTGSTVAVRTLGW